jgi:hypothetical protein
MNFSGLIAARRIRCRVQKQKPSEEKIVGPPHSNGCDVRISRSSCGSRSGETSL